MPKILKFIQDFFTNGETTDIIARCLLIAVMTVVYFVVFYYAKKRNLNMLIWIVCVSLAIMFVFAFFDIPRYQIYVLVLLMLIFIASLLLFAQDFRRDLFRKSRKRWLSDWHGEMLGREDLQSSVEEIIKACQKMSKTDTGALILIADNVADSILDSGTPVNAKISADLLRTLFFPKTPLHDGAMVINGSKVHAAGCFLPLSQEVNLPKELGTRHRAGIGITETISVTSLIVSEETGIISIAQGGKIKRYVDSEMLRQALKEYYWQELLEQKD